MTRSITALLAVWALALFAPASAFADGWADEDYDEGDDPDAKEILEHVTRADALAKAPTIPLMISGLVIAGPGALAASGDTLQGLSVSNGGGVLLGMSLGTSITGGLIANLFGGNTESWSLFIAGAATSTMGVVLYQAGFQSYIGGTIPGGGDEFYLVAPAVVAGLSCVIVGEILTMSSSGSIEDRYEEMVAVAPRRRAPTFALAPAPMGQGGGVVLAGTW
jgi:hypothetical protein